MFKFHKLLAIKVSVLVATFLFFIVGNAGLALYSETLLIVQNSTGTTLFSVTTSSVQVFLPLKGPSGEVYPTSSASGCPTDCLQSANNLSDLVSTSSARSNIGLGNLVNVLQLQAANNLSDLVSTSTARTNIGYSGGFAIAISSTGTIGFVNQGYITTSTNLTTANFQSANISQWTNNSGYLTTSTNLGVANFASANISQWTNNSGYITTSSISIGGIASSTFNIGTGLSISATGTISNTGVLSNPGWITTSSITIGGKASSTFSLGTALVISATGTIGFSNPGYITTSSITIGGVASSTFNIGTNLVMSATGTLGFVNNSGFISSIAGGVCSGTDKISAISATGTITCTADVSSAGGSPYYTPHNVFIASAVWTNMTAAVQEILNTDQHRQKYNFVSSTQIALYSNLTVAGAAAGTKIMLQYSTNTTNWFFAGAATGTPVLTIGNTAGGKMGSYTNVTTTNNLKNLGDVWIRIIGDTGNGTADPNFNSIMMYVR